MASTHLLPIGTFPISAQHSSTGTSSYIPMLEIFLSRRVSTGPCWPASPCSSSDATSSGSSLMSIPAVGKLEPEVSIAPHKQARYSAGSGLAPPAHPHHDSRRTYPHCHELDRRLLGIGDN